MSDNMFIKKLADIIPIDETTLDFKSRLDSGVIDSVSLIEILALVDECYDVSVSGQEINNCCSVRELLNLIHTKKGKYSGSYRSKNKEKGKT